MALTSRNATAFWNRQRNIFSLLIVSLLVVPPVIFLTTIAEAVQTGSGSVSLTTLGAAYGQDFNTLALSGTSSALPNGWYFDEAGTNANATYTAGTGSLNAGDTYSFGATSNAERALGGLRSGSLVPILGASFTNNTGSPITNLAISYTGEEWRLGTAGRADRLDFQISTNATSLTTGTWTDQNGLDFTSPNTGPTIGALDGNSGPNRTLINSTISGLNIPSGATFFIRWTDLDATGADDGLSVDDFSLTPTNVPTPTNPSVSGAANPASVSQGGSVTLTGTVTPGANPTSTGLAVTGDLTAIGGSPTQQFFDDGSHGDGTPNDNVFTFQTTVNIATTPGSKSLPLTVTDAQVRSGSGSISLTVTAPTVPPGTVVISQIYGGGGNSGASYKNDFIEIFNRSSSTVNLSGWSVQYASAAGTSWTNKTTLTGTIAPGQYFLIQEAAGVSGDGLDLPPANVIGTINMSSTDGKVALVSDNTSLTGGCPLGNPSIVDFIGYGSASCFEGAGAAPGLDNQTADLRTHDGCKDTDSNGGNFTAGAPNPRNTSSALTICPTGDFPPEIFSTVPGANQTHIPLDSNITINFDEPVNVSGSWYQISCGTTGVHTAGVSGGPVSFTLNPDTDFTFNEPCSVTIFAAQVTDQDLNDPPDNMVADYSFTFNSEFFRDPAEHMLMGNPSNATTDPGMTTNYLMMKTQYALSYNNDRGTPNWTSWHLDLSWRGSAPRQDDFRADTTLPPGFYQVQGTDYQLSGFDRGHMCPSADRTSTIADNSATFLMTNMTAQAPGNNQGPWAAMENYLRTLLSEGDEIYILSGGSGVGGVGSNGPADTIANGHVTVPAVTWKVALVLPVGDNDVARVDGNTRSIAVIMPNDTAIRPDQWQKYLATVDQVEAVSGYNLYSNVPTEIQDVFEAKLDTVNDTAPVTSDQTGTTAEDEDVAVTLSATDFNVNNVLSYAVVDGPQHGTISGSGASLTYSPDAHYFGSDSFTFKANDGALDSNVSTVQITVTEVNNDPTTVSDNKTTAEGSPLVFPASDLTSNDSAGPNENGQSLTVDSIISMPDTHGSITLNSGQVTYTPAADYNGPASFDYHVCDDGTTNGFPDAKCATGTVNVTVTEVNNIPSAVNDSKITSEDTPLNFAAADLTGNDSPGPANESGQTLNVVAVMLNPDTHGSVSLLAGQITYTPAANYNGPASFDYQVCDDGTTNGAPDSKCATASVNLTVTGVNDVPIAGTDTKTTAEDSQLSFPAGDLLVNDSAGPANESDQTLTVTSVSSNANTHGTVFLNSGQVSFTPAGNYNGAASFDYQVCDNGSTNGLPDAKCTTGRVDVTISSVNDPPVLTGVPAMASVAYGSELTFTAHASDVDVPSQTLVFSLVGAPAGASINPATGVFSWTPTAAQAENVYSFAVAVTDGQSSVSSPITVTVNLQALTALGPAQIWLGLKSSDDVGTRFDLLAEVFKNGILIGSGQLNDAPGGSSGFNNAILRTINLVQGGPVGFRTGDVLSVRLSVRIAASSGHNAGTARLWFNDAAANSRFAATIGGVARLYFLRSGLVLAESAGPGPKATIDVMVNRNIGGNAFKPFGTWSVMY
ncbi:MAG TPA: Ig-like domain-containing protein [Pyrinomonadaceae bacterium]|nr:Ig-like domain-containing protein [Pyrinomonadaceae bacterium]